MQRNYNPELHPFEVSREYTRALNAAKLERVFAKPFVGSLDGHQDGVQIIRKHPTRLSTLLSGSCDGEVHSLLFSSSIFFPLTYHSSWILQIKQWNLAERKNVRTIQAHSGIIRGICFHYDGSSFYTVSSYFFYFMVILQLIIIKMYFFYFRLAMIK